MEICLCLIQEIKQTKANKGLYKGLYTAYINDYCITVADAFQPMMCGVSSEDDFAFPPFVHIRELDLISLGTPPG